MTESRIDLELLRELKSNGNGIMELANENPGLFGRSSPQGNTTLHIASRTGNLSVVQEIIKIQPHLVFQTNKRGETPLHIAAAAGDVNVVKLLYDKMKTDSENGQVNILSIKDSEDNTPLHMAVRNCHLEVVKELIDTEQGFPVNKAGQSSLSIAIDASSTNIACWIISKKPDSLNYEGSNKMTLLHSAVIRRNYDVTLEILNARKDLVTKEDVRQRNALHYAAAAADEVKNIVALLSKEDVSLAYKRDCNGQTPIHLATINGQFGVVEMLVNDYPDVIEVLDNNQRNILHLAAQHGHGDIVSFILQLPEKDDLLNTLDQDGNTPLHLAAMNFRDNVVDTLCREMKLYIMATNHKHQTALEIAQKSEVEATEKKKYLTLEALKETYKYRTLDPEDIIANGCLSGSGTSTTYDQGKFERDKKLAEVILTLNSIIAAFTFTTALTIPEKFVYSRVPEQNGKLLSTHFHLDKEDCFVIFMAFIAASSASCLFASFIISFLFWINWDYHEYFIKRLTSAAMILTILGLISMSLAFMLGVFLVLSSNRTIPKRTALFVSILPIYFYLGFSVYFWVVPKRTVSSFTFGFEKKK